MAIKVKRPTAKQRAAVMKRFSVRVGALDGHLIPMLDGRDLEFIPGDFGEAVKAMMKRCKAHGYDVSSWPDRGDVGVSWLIDRVLSFKKPIF